MEILAVAGIGITAAVLAYIFREVQKEYAVLITLGAGILLLVWGFTKLVPMIEYITQLSAKSAVSEYFSLILKVCGVCFIIGSSSEICRDLGENSLAGKVEFAGKAVILVMILPLIKDVISLALGLI